jgi:hypothetical protein
MCESRINLLDIMTQAAAADVAPLRRFFFSNPEKPLMATGSGGAETVADFVTLLYGARGGVGTSVSPYTMNSISDEALKTSKLLLVSAGGHNNDIVFTAKRGLAVNRPDTASFTLSKSDRNEVRKLFLKAGSNLSFDIPIHSTPDGFVSTTTPIKYFALIARTFDPGCDLMKYVEVPHTTFRVEHNDGSNLPVEDLRDVGSFVILHGSWGRPVAANLEGKLVESGLASASVYDYRNYCHGRFIYTSNHLKDSAVIMFITPREHDIARRIRSFLPARTRLVIIETSENSPEASLDLLIKSTWFFFNLCEATGTNYDVPSNPGRIDKRVPMWIPFMSEMKKEGPLTI